MEIYFSELWALVVLGSISFLFFAMALVFGILFAVSLSRINKHIKATSEQVKELVSVTGIVNTMSKDAIRQKGFNPDKMSKNVMVKRVGSGSIDRLKII